MERRSANRLGARDPTGVQVTSVLKGPKRLCTCVTRTGPGSRRKNAGGPEKPGSGEWPDVLKREEGWLPGAVETPGCRAVQLGVCRSAFGGDFAGISLPTGSHLERCKGSLEPHVLSHYCAATSPRPLPAQPLPGKLSVCSPGSSQNVR